MNYIIGSGLVAFLAKHMLPDWEIIPSGKSRFFQYDVATCDGYVIYNDTVLDVVRSILIGCSNDITPLMSPMMFKRAISFGGELVFNRNEALLSQWLRKVYGADAPAYSFELFPTEFFVYGMSAMSMFRALEQKSLASFRKSIERQESIVSVYPQEKYIRTSHRELEYDKCISTVPLDAFLKWCGMPEKLYARDMHTCLIQTNKIDFEGASEALIADQEIDFYKCTRISRDLYQFFSVIEIPQVAHYISLMVPEFDIVSGTCVKNAIPVGKRPGLTTLEKLGVYCVGSTAQWDDFMDITSCLMRLQKIKESCDG